MFRNPPSRPSRQRRRLLVLLLTFSLAPPFAASAWAQEAEPSDTPVRQEADLRDVVTEPNPDFPSAIAQFTTGVEDREPIDQITFVSTEIDQITFYSDLRGLTGQQVTHRWIYRGEIRARVPFEVRGPRWRVWSSKTLEPEWTGDWTVEIVDEAGEVIAAETFTYQAPES